VWEDRFFYFFLREGIISIMMFGNVGINLSSPIESAFLAHHALLPHWLNTLVWSSARCAPFS
jgi:hypothetical protein